MTDSSICPECGAEIEANAARCWLCHFLPERVDQQPSKLAQKQRQFGMASIFLTVTLCSVLFGVLRLAPGIGIVLAIVVTPAFLRATVLGARQKAIGQSSSSGRKFITFLGSFGLVVSVLLSAGLAFYITCWGGFLSATIVAEVTDGPTGMEAIGWGFGVGITVGVIGQLIFTILFIRWLWKRRAQNRNRLGDVGFIFSWLGLAMTYTMSILRLKKDYFLDDVSIWLVVIPAIIGGIMSLIAIRKPQRVLASLGIGFGIATCGSAIVYTMAGSGGFRNPTPSAIALLVLNLVLTPLVAVGFSAVTYWLMGRSTRDLT